MNTSCQNCEYSYLRINIHVHPACVMSAYQFVSYSRTCSFLRVIGNFQCCSFRNAIVAFMNWFIPADFNMDLRFSLSSTVCFYCKNCGWHIRVEHRVEICRSTGYRSQILSVLFSLLCFTFVTVDFFIRFVLFQTLRSTSHISKDSFVFVCSTIIYLNVQHITPRFPKELNYNTLTTKWQFGARCQC